MTHLLLLGAGFSRNWGGWLAPEVFEYLLGAPEVLADPELRTLLWRHHTGGGFEAALEEIQLAFRRDPDTNRLRLSSMQQAIARMFDDLNGAFFSRDSFEFRQPLFRDKAVTTFLARFDAIFTLNQDVLLEHFYIDHHNIGLTNRIRWDSIELPGMEREHSNDVQIANSWAKSKWHPGPERPYQVTPRHQPYYKLHGSSNWRTAEGAALLVLGGQKPFEIHLHAVLTTYAEKFEQFLNAGETRLMIIGYGFRDDHINRVLSRAVEAHGLKFFLISPSGGDLAKELNPTRQRNQIVARSPLEGMFEQGLIGASRRGLADTFGDDEAEFNKVMRFFM